MTPLVLYCMRAFIWPFCTLTVGVFVWFCRAEFDGYCEGELIKV